MKKCNNANHWTKECIMEIFFQTVEWISSSSLIPPRSIKDALVVGISVVAAGVEKSATTIHAGACQMIDDIICSID